MPVADEKLEEKAPFDVYAMMLILSFIVIAVAIYLLNNESQEHWKAGSPPGTEVAVDLTKFNDDEGKFKDQIILSNSDKKEYKVITGADIPGVEEKPEWMKNKPVDPTPGVDNTEGIHEDLLRKYKESYINPLLTPDDPDKKADAAPAEAPKAP